MTGPSGGRERLRVRQIATAYQESKAVLAAVRLGLFDDLSRGGRSARELAAERGFSPGALELLLNALTAMDLLKKASGRFALAPPARRYLVEGGPESMAPLFRHQDHMWGMWSGLEEAVRGGPAPGGEAEELEDFMGAMAVNGRLGAPAVCEALDMTGVRRLLDLGGGPGIYAEAFLKRRPDLEVTLFDFPDAVAIARRRLEAGGLGGRVRLRGGDLFTDDIGGGYDLVFASNLLHIFGEEDVARIIGRCLTALAEGGMLALNDFYLEPQRTRPRRAAVFALHMLVLGRGGRTYAYEEMETMLARGGFTDVTRLPVTEQGGLVTARKPPRAAPPT